ncbi:hypothetical protein PQR62_14795 [Herbaspirillum lusitanum]|uniref:Uncharacterized protein n=1 Tax=Herbaspirillum lusitanum TaxID=213312 RepID=A0ABW9AC16_9BURK
MTIYIHQISRAETTSAYTGAQPAAPAQTGFMTLAPGARKDWGNYAAIRNYFLNESVDEEALYGFVSEDFHKQTGLGLPEIARFIEKNPGNDAYVFFPFTGDAACFLNVFEEGEFHHPGLRDLAQRYLDAIGLALDLRELVTDFRTTTHIGYVVAKPVFWKTWFDLAEQVFAIAEAGMDALTLQLNATSTGAVPTPMKVLLTERLASLVLALDQQLRVATFDPATLPPTDLSSLAYRDEFPKLDALKRNYLETRDIALIDEFFVLRNSILTSIQEHANSKKNRHAEISGAHGSPNSDSELVYGCITHVELPIRFPDFVTPIYLGESQAEGRLNLRDLAPQWLPYHHIVGGMVGNFALRNHILKHHPKVKRIGVCMYRKFVSRYRISSVPAEENWLMDVVSNKELERQSFESMLDPDAMEILVGKTCGLTVDGKVSNYLSNYAREHHAEDLLRFTAQAVELGVLQPHETDSFLNERYFFTGGVELGVFPAEFWLKSIAAIEAVTWACVQRYQMKREGYQARAWAFCAERFGSYLLLRYTHSLGYTNLEKLKEITGQLNLITKDDQTLYVRSN